MCNVFIGKLQTYPGYNSKKRRCKRLETEQDLLFWKLKTVNIFKTLKYKKQRLRVYKKVYVGIQRGATITNVDNGRLNLGLRHYNQGGLDSTIALGNGSKLILNCPFEIYTGFTISVNKNATLEFGSGYANNGLFIACFNSIKIGKNVAIAENVTIRDDNNHTILYDGYIKSKPIEICDNVWIGMNVTILKGVTVGEGSVIAAGSVVTKDVPPHSLVAGVPAKIIKEKIEWKL